ncbi:MAG: M48 family metalloprotease [Fimbriimonadaceae bacterium]|nr:MAG: M48 family metalloprotease [Fimbriimonadaceae bacterium]
MKVRCLIPVVAAFALLTPASADPFRPSVRQQIDLGKEAAAQVRKEEKILPDSDPRVKELRRLGAMLVSQIPDKEKKDKPFEYTFDVIDSKEINAFALPGGPIFFYTGLLDKMKTEDEVIGILGHELTHIRNQHWASQYADNMKRKVGILVVLTILQANSDILNATDMLDSILVGLPYSRKHETESDNVGYDMMTNAGYNPRGMIDVFKIIIAESKGSKPPEILNSHPDTEKRIQSLEQRIKADKRKFPAMRPRKVTTFVTAADVTWNAGWPNLGSGQSSNSAPLQKGGSGSLLQRLLAEQPRPQWCGTH